MISVPRQLMTTEELAALAKSQLEEIFCTSGIDKGIIYSNTESPTYWDAKKKAFVYKHEHFSELGVDLVKLHETIEALILSIRKTP